MIAIVDTSLFIALESGRSLGDPPDGRDTAVSVVTIAELEYGLLCARDAASRAARLATLRAAERTPPVPIDRVVASRFAELVAAMRAAGAGRLGVQDAWIAATALAHGAEVWTQDEDFDRVPGLDVVRL